MCLHVFLIIIIIIQILVSLNNSNKQQQTSLLLILLFIIIHHIHMYIYNTFNKNIYFTFNKRIYFFQTFLQSLNIPLNLIRNSFFFKLKTNLSLLFETAVKKRWTNTAYSVVIHNCLDRMKNAIKINRTYFTRITLMENFKNWWKPNKKKQK